jgi:hypothetical protein
VSEQPMITFASHQARAGMAGASEDFEQMLGLLVRVTEGEANLVFANPGDWGIDVLVGDLNGRASVWQAKYFRLGVGRSQQAQIAESFALALRAAARHAYVLERWVLCIPASMDGPTTQWWQAWKADREQETGVAIELWDETVLRELLLRPEAADIYRHYYAPYPGGQAEHAVSFAAHQVRAGAADAGEDFDQMLALLVRATSGEANAIFANPGDWGIDALTGDSRGQVTVWQAKYFARGVGRSQQGQVTASFGTALRAAHDHGYDLERWVLCIPSSMDGPTMKWWQAWKAEQKRKTGITVNLWDETRLRELLLRPEAADVRRHFYDPYWHDGLVAVDINSVREAFLAERPDVLLDMAECDWLDAKSEPYKLSPQGSDTGGSRDANERAKNEHAKIERAKNELAKDVAAFANTKTGGLLLIGFHTSKKNGVDTIDQVRPVPRNLVDLDQYSKLISSRVIPAPHDVKVVWIGRGNDNGILMIDVPAQSPGRLPHVVWNPDGDWLAVPLRDGDRNRRLPSTEIQHLLSIGWTSTSGPDHEGSRDS